MQEAEDRIIAMIDELERLAQRRSDAWQIPREEGEFLYNLVLSSRARLVVEVGTSYGFSGLFLGAALRATRGLLHTIDSDRRKHEMAKATFEKAGLADIIIGHLGDARDILPTIEGPIDMVFLDADKALARQFFDLAWNYVRRGGSVLTDNVLTHRQELRDFVRYVRSRADARSGEIAIGNGLEWTVKVA